MRLPGKLNFIGRVPRLTRMRILFALAIAVVADGLQFLLGPAGWVFGDQVIDVITMLLVGSLIGFHWLLLPSFILELIPLADEFPTWIACVTAVIILRKRGQQASPPLPSGKPVIEI